MADHIQWEEWKYRHEAWWKTLYRSVWTVIIIAILPWIKVDVSQEVSRKHPTLYAVGYFGILLLKLRDLTEGKPSDAESMLAARQSRKGGLSWPPFSLLMY
jgi:hypothetical protein